MSENPRRKLLKSIALGSGAIVSGKSLPEQWARPVVDAVLLPSHAITSPATFTSGGSLPSAAAGMINDNDSLLANLSGTMIEDAQANDFNPEIPCIVDNGDGTVTVDVTIQTGDAVKYQKVVTVGAAKVNMDLCEETFAENQGFDGFGLIGAAHADIFIPLVEVRIDSIDGRAMGALFVEETSEYVIDLPQGPCASATCTPFVASDRNIKDNFSKVDEQEILRKVAALNIEHWNYTDREKGVRHIGPMAQDFMAAFNVGDSDRHIHMVDANGVNMAAIKALNSRLEEKDAQICMLQQQLDQVIRKLGLLEQKS